MWVSFGCHGHPPKRFAIKPYVGGINGISGESMIGDMTTLTRRLNQMAPRQDYIAYQNSHGWMVSLHHRGE